MSSSWDTPRLRTIEAGIGAKSFQSHHQVFELFPTVLTHSARPHFMFRYLLLSLIIAAETMLVLPSLGFVVRPSSCVEKA